MRMFLSATVTLTFLLGQGSVQAGTITADFVEAGLEAPAVDAPVWNGKPATEIALMAQPMTQPRPASTRTERLNVQAVHNGRWIAFRLEWADPDRSEAGRLGQYSDAVAIQFPGPAAVLPVAFMGSAGSPVHLFHWRAQYQRDADKGPQTIADIYPNLAIDMYPFQFKDHGNLPPFTDEDRRAYQPAQAAGNPQAFPRTSGVAEMVAEGFGTSTALPDGQAVSDARWHEGKWTVVIARPLSRENASVLKPGAENNVAFAVWQGGEGEVGARKSLTLSWTPLRLTPAT